MTKLLHRWKGIVIACITLASVASAERLTTFFWDASPTWPTGTTVELCGNGPTCLTGLTGQSATLTLPINPGEVIQGMARAYAPDGRRSEWATVTQTWPQSPVAPWAWKGIVVMADPTYQGSGTLDYSSSSSVSSLSTTITNVEVGDLLVVQVQRDYQDAITSVASASPALTFVRQARADPAKAVMFFQDVYTAIATAAASSMTITASYSSSAAWGAMISYRWSGGISSGTATQVVADSSLRSTSTNRTVANITTTARTLLIAAGSDWNYYLTHTAAANWTKILDSQTKGTDSTTLYLYARIADAGTYPNGNFATTNLTDTYFGSILALPIEMSSSVTGLPRRAIDGPLVGALRGSVR